MKTSDQQEVECDIYGTGQSYKIERCARVSQPAQDSANDIVTDNERNPQRADQQIMAGVAHGFGRSMHQCGYRIVEQGHEQGKKTSHQQQTKQCEEPNDGRSFFVIACSGAMPISTVMPVVSPRMIPVTVCITWLPMATPATLAASSNCPTTKRSALRKGLAAYWPADRGGRTETVRRVHFPVSNQVFSFFCLFSLFLVKEKPDKVIGFTQSSYPAFFPALR